jgi:CRISPR-associated exonuclease Cas4
MDKNKIQVSGIQHYMYCKRRWALLYIENLWKDNFLTFDGDRIHKKVHDSSIKESREDKFIERGTYIGSEIYNLTGQCDAIEFYKDKKGIQLKNKEDLWIIVPVEYKHGDGSSIDIDKYQLFAQILCLEEMYTTKINYGYIYCEIPRLT